MPGKYFNDTLRAIGLMLLLFVPSFGQQPSPTVAPTPLELGRSIESEIAAAQKQFYTIHLEAGQFAKIEAVPSGCDVTLTFYALDNKASFDIKNDALTDGAEVVVAAVKEPGDYQVRVSLAGRADARGKYSLKIVELRAATEKEFAYSAGRKMMSELEMLMKADSSAENIQLAITKYEQARQLFRTAEAGKFEGVALDSIGNMYARLGNRLKALEFFQLALNKYRSLGIKYLEARVLNSIGRIHSFLGDRQKAIETLLEALAVAKEAKHQMSEALALNGIGSVYYRLGDPERADSYHCAALKIFEELNDKYNQAVTLNYLGNASSSSKNERQAIEHYQRAIALEKTLTGRQPTASYLSNLGTTYFRLGETDKAFEYLHQALSLTRTKGDKINEADFLHKLGNINLALNKNTEAIEALRQSLQIYRSIEDPTRMAETLLALARAESQTGSLSEAQTHIEEALRLIEDFRSRVCMNELRNLFSANLKDYYGFYVELLLQRHRLEPGKGFAAQALQANERARARGLLNLLAESSVNIREGVDRKLLERETELKNLLSARMENLTNVLGIKSQPEQVETLKREVEQLRVEYEHIQAQIRQHSPRYAALTQPKILNLPEIQREVLDTDTVLLEYALGDTRSFLWVVANDSFEVVELPKRTEVERLARLVYENLTARNKPVKFETTEERDVRIAQADADFSENIESLSLMILAPAAKFIQHKRLLIVADGILQYVPFAALKIESSELTKGEGHKPRGKFLVETNEIVNLPSASFLATQRRELKGRVPAPKTLAILADPVFDNEDERFKVVLARNKLAHKDTALTPVKFGPTLAARTRNRSAGNPDDDERLDFPRLPFTRLEADSIAALLPPEQRKKVLDFAANRQTALNSELGHYRFVHFATHSFINNDNPELSGIVLSLIDEQGKEQNGILRVNDIFNLKLPAELVVLSGCRTGLGKEIKGEGLVGLTRGFMYAGARRVTVSLWDVNDEATAQLMTRFYRGLLGKEKLSPSAALRRAQISLLQEDLWQHPYYWASFVLHGEPLSVY